ncbi:MAG: Ig-like domain-containing protein, partial [Agathobacter sp.]|nr:Ig-like domain-containing protein [Agathobacter sp.]
MMKSFFKKLSLVMAAAMVVSTAAPATQTAYAASDLKIAKQNVKEAIASINVGVGESVDLWYLGAPKNYKELNPTWSSDLEAVAKVDQKGNVTGVAAGVATISIALSDGSEAEVAVTVGEPVVYDVVLGTAKDNTFSELTLALDEAKDLGFFGVKDWKASNYVCEWSVDGDAVTVDNKTGVVTAVAPGTATVNFSIKNKTNGVAHKVTPVVVTVPDEKATYEAYQTSEITFDVEFSNTVTYGRDNVQLYRVFNTDEGDVYVVWAVEKAWLNADGTILTVQPYVQFGDGERYLVKFADDEKGYEFNTYIGEITSVKVTYTSKDEQGLNAPGVAYTNGEDAEEDIDVVLDYQVYSGRVNLTNIYKDRNDFDVAYEMVTPEDSDYIDLSDDTLVFTKANQTAGVKAEVTYENEDGEDVTISSKIEYITSKTLPPLDIAYIKNWTIVGTDNDVDWSKAVDHDLRAGKNGYIELVLVDNRGTTWVTAGASTLKDSKLFGSEDSATEEMYLTFHSTNTDRFVVDETNAKVEAYKEKEHAVIYISLHDRELEDDFDTDFVRNIGAIDLALLEPSELAGLVIKDKNDFWNGATKTGITLVTDAVDDPANDDSEYFVDMLTTDTLYVFPVDQDGALYTSNGSIDYEISTKNDDVQEELIDNGTLDVESNGELFIDAKLLEEVAGNSSYTFNITATEYDDNGKKADTAKTSLRVSAKDPELDDEGNVVVEGWGVSAGNAGLQATNGSSEAKIEVNMLSNKQIVGYYNRYDMTSASSASLDNKITIVENKDDYKFGNDTEDGEINVPGIYVMVEGPDGKAVQKASGSSLGVYVNEEKYYVGVRVTSDDDGDGNAEAADTDGIVGYLATGDYTVYVTFVTPSEETGKVDTKKKTVDFEVYDNIDHVKFVDMYDVETSIDISGIADEDIKDLIFKNYKLECEYQHDGQSWNNTLATTVDGNAPKVQIVKWDCKVKGEYILIKSITFKVDCGGGKYYYSFLDDIDRSVRFGVDE